MSISGLKIICRGKRYLNENIYALHLVSDRLILVVYAGLFEKERFFCIFIGKDTAAMCNFYRSVFLSPGEEW